MAFRIGGADRFDTMTADDIADFMGLFGLRTAAARQRFIEGEIAPMLTICNFPQCLPLLQVILPVGVSFFTFQGMSYTIDVYRGRTRPASLLDITLLMSFFPHLVAGPIVRAAHLVPRWRCC